MLAPLLTPSKEENTAPSTKRKATCILKLALITCFFLILPYLTSAIRAFQITSEESVGNRPNWRPFLDAYFSIGGLVSTLTHTSPYFGKEYPEVDIKNCEDITTSCMDYCIDFISGPRHFASSSADVSSSRSKGRPKYCWKITAKDLVITKCWDTSIVRCWNEFGGNQVYDGSKEWTLTRHFQGDEDLEMQWMHLVFEKWGMLVFEWGYVKPIQQVCDEIKESPELMRLAGRMLPSKNIIIVGHSEGSAAAICFNEILAQNKDLTNSRYVIGTGVLVPSSEQFYRRMSRYTQEHSLFLMVESLLPENRVGGGMMPDIFPLLSVPEGMTFPSFAFSCDENSECVSITRRANLHEAMLKADGMTVSPDPMVRASLNAVISGIHSFEYYRSCYNACKVLFDRNPRHNFEVNTPQFRKRPPQAEEDRIPALPHCNFC